MSCDEYFSFMRLKYLTLNWHLSGLFILYAFALMIQSCSVLTSNKGVKSIPSQVISSNLLSDIDYNLNQPINYDSLILFEDSLFRNLDSIFEEISLGQFQNYKHNYKLNCEIDSGHFIKGSGLNVRHI